MILGPPKKSSRRLWLATLFGTGALAALLGLQGPRRAQASIMIALDLPALVQRADHIAVVDVASVQAAWDERHERIYSTIELNVVESWKSPTAVTHLTVVQPGGTVDDLTMTVMGMSVFVPGERSLVFLSGPATHAKVVGMTQGKRPMRYESAARNWMVAPPDLHQTTLIPPRAGARPLAPATSRVQSANTIVAPTATRDLPLEQMHVEIKRLLAAAQP